MELSRAALILFLMVHYTKREFICIFLERWWWKPFWECTWNWRSWWWHRWWWECLPWKSTWNWSETILFADSNDKTIRLWKYFNIPGGGKYGGNGGIRGADGAPGSGGCCGIILNRKEKQTKYFNKQIDASFHIESLTGLGGIGGGGIVVTPNECCVGIGAGGGGGIIGFIIIGTGASANNWWGRSLCDKGFCAANKRSAAEPWRSPLESFLNAYDTVIGRLHKYWPFIASIAASDASKLAKLMNANPFELPVSGSRIICSWWLHWEINQSSFVLWFFRSKCEYNLDYLWCL